MSAPLDARAIVCNTCYAGGGYSTDYEYGIRQILHRVEIVSRFKIQPGANVLEVGCGRSDCTVVLAAAVGENGHVTAVDPASLDYAIHGTPILLVYRCFSHLVCDREPVYVGASPKTHISGRIRTMHHMGAR